MRKLFILIFLSICTLQATENYRLVIDEISYEEVDSEMKVLFTLNNFYTFVGDLDEELIEKFPPGTPVIFECDSSGFCLRKRTYHGPFFYHTDSYPITIPLETLEPLPSIVSLEKGSITKWEPLLDYLLTLDDGSVWIAPLLYYPERSKIISAWNTGDRVIISYTAYGNYSIVNVDTPNPSNRQGTLRYFWWGYTLY